MFLPLKLPLFPITYILEIDEVLCFLFQWVAILLITLIIRLLHLKPPFQLILQAKVLVLQIIYLGILRFRRLSRARNLRLRSKSAAIDAGDSQDLDVDNSRADIGASGGLLPDFSDD